ncbi:hypothetical protein CHS0354_012950 [Potamilus streckersoni]|uniref:Heat shock 70 kDa protein 12A n=1 Tax=Potamilus streckersoni TaxID=2493646 RepID=A0AAE0RNP3_9BIVA|nr:hypothetical protein CHS0354_012950 [Potamilus streckersoni]
MVLQYQSIYMVKSVYSIKSVYNDNDTRFTIYLRRMASQTHLIVAAIDFGTSYSGWAFSFKHEFETDPKKICTKNCVGPGMMTPKAPTTVLIKPDGMTFHSFGYDAESKYEELSPEEAKQWYYFKRFKMTLHGKKLDRSLSLTDATGKHLPARVVFSLAIRYLREDMLININDRLAGGRMRDEEIFWVLTVPAIWDDGAKQFMREVAVKAGIQDKHLTIALEPEAASIFCRLIPIQKRSEGEMSPFRPGSKYMILDAGGGTVDVTVHKVRSDGKLKELYRATGGGWGGTKVDEAFDQFIADLVGHSVFERFCRECSSDHLVMLREFEVKKRKIVPEHTDGNQDQEGDTTTVYIRLPMSLRDIYEEETGDVFRKAIKQGQHAEEVSLTGEKLMIPVSIMRSFFVSAILSITSHVKDLMKDDKVKAISAILMVGGFSESKMLQDAIRTNCPKVDIVIPPDAGLVVLKGAVVFGHNANIMAQRVCKYTYGVSACVKFDPAKHDQGKKIIRNGKLYCDDIFHQHVEMGQTVTLNEVQSEEDYLPLEEDQEEIGFDIYAATEKFPTYVTDEGCVKLGTVTIKIHDRSVPLKQRNVSVSMTFSGTEIEVSAKDVLTGQSTSVFVDFLETK